MSECAPDGVFTPTAEWLYSVLLPKVVQWSEESRRGDRLPQHQSLVPLDRYCSLYRQLKDKYGPPLIKVYTLYTHVHVCIIHVQEMHNTHVHVHDIVYMDYCTVYRVVFLKVEIFVNTKFGPFENFLLYCIIHV